MPSPSAPEARYPAPPPPSPRCHRGGCRCSCAGRGRAQGPGERERLQKAGHSAEGRRCADRRLYAAEAAVNLMIKPRDQTS